MYLFDHSLLKDYTLTSQMKSKKKFLLYILLTSGIWFKVDHIILVTNYPYISQNSLQNRLYFNHMLDVSKTVSFDLCSLQLNSITTTITHENYHVVSVCAWALTVWEVGVHDLDWTHTQGLKITEENVLPLLWHLQALRHSSFLG